MDIALLTLIIVSGIGLIICLIGMYKCGKELDRNKKVAQFRYMLSDMAHDYNMRHIKELNLDNVHEVWEWFANKWSYDDMFYSSRPLVLEEWYTQEELERINS